MADLLLTMRHVPLPVPRPDLADSWRVNEMVTNLPDIFSTPSASVNIYDLPDIIETSMGWLFLTVIGVVLGLLFYNGVKSIFQWIVTKITNND